MILRRYICMVSIAGGMVSMMAAPAGAHHSFAMFDQTKTVVVKGTVSKFDITTPHSWLYIVAADGTHWSFESEGPGALARAGLHHSTLKVGDKVEVTTHPMRDRANVGSMLNVITADGVVHTIFPSRPDAAGGAPGAPPGEHAGSVEVSAKMRYGLLAGALLLAAAAGRPAPPGATRPGA